MFIIFKKALAKVHLKVNPNYKLFKLFNVLLGDLETEFKKVYDYITNEIDNLKSWVENQITILNNRIDNIVTGDAPPLAKNMKQIFEDGLNNYETGQTYTKTIDYPTGYNQTNTVILGQLLYVTAGSGGSSSPGCYDFSAIMENYSITVGGSNISVTFKMKTTLELSTLSMVITKGELNE